MNLGAHMSISGGLDKALERGVQIGCHAVQIFSKSNNQWIAKDIAPKEMDRFKSLKQKFARDFIFVHDSYLINLASPKEDVYQKSLDAFLIEMKRVEDLGLSYLVMHPGSHLNQGEEWGIQRIIKSFNFVFDQTPELKMMVLLEATAGQGTNIGYRFEQLRDIINGVNNSERLGVCIDTCHIFAAGYDIRNEKAYDSVFAEFDNLIGLHKIKAFHLNDSKKDLGSRVDRHEHIGKGFIGIEAFRLLMNDSRFKNLPMVLETPKGKDMQEDIDNLKTLRDLIK